MANVSDDYTERLTQACNASVEFSMRYKGLFHRFSLQQFYEMFAQEILFYKPIELLGGQVWGEGILVTYDCDDLQRMYDTGVISQGKVELLEGHIFAIPEQSQETTTLELDLGMELLHVVGDEACMKGGYIIELGAKTALMPGIAVLRGSNDRYDIRNASIGDVLLIAEAVNEKPEYFDFKLQALARADMPEYWLLNTQTKQLEVYSLSNGIEFEHHATLEVGQKVTPLEFPNREIRWW